MLNPTAAHLRALTANDLPQVLAWRNHPQIRQWMTHHHVISPEEHQRWFEHSRQHPNRLLFLFEYQQQAQGYASLQQLPHSPCFEWGFYVRPDAAPGMGTLLGKTVLDLACRQLNIAKIFAQVLGNNAKSIHLHRKLGFVQEGCLRQHFQDERGILDIVQFGLLQSEWLERQQHD